MTKYAIRMIPGEPRPCALADPSGCFYSTGEVDREISRLMAQLEVLNARTHDAGTVQNRDGAGACSCGYWDEEGTDG